MKINFDRVNCYANKLNLKFLKEFADIDTFIYYNNSNDLENFLSSFDSDAFNFLFSKQVIFLFDGFYLMYKEIVKKDLLNMQVNDAFSLAVTYFGGADNEKSHD